MQVVPRKCTDLDTDKLEKDINRDFVQNSHYHEDVILEMYQKPNKSHFQEPPGLQGLASTGKLVWTFLPK